MTNMSIGIVELLIVVIVALVGFGIPVAILVLLYKVYTKLKDIEEQLKKQ
jgi:hypothetical protein